MLMIDERTRRPRGSTNLTQYLNSKIVGQVAAIGGIVPYVQMHQSGLCSEGRPVGVFLLLGPSGSGKTKTVEALAEALHGSEKNLLRIDCGEFQMEHEVAKLIGAPPGYLGHRETHPLLTQPKLNGVTSEHSNLSIVLFDEIEKAAPSMTRLLLGVLDKAELRLGDNTTANFEKTIIFMTSNLGAREMLNQLKPGVGFARIVPRPDPENDAAKLAAIGMAAVRKRFAPEFVNRVDGIFTYAPLSAKSINEILDIQLAELEKHVYRRLGSRAFHLEIRKSARALLLAKGTSLEFGARELKRTIQRMLVQPLSSMIVNGELPPQSRVRAEAARDGKRLRFQVLRPPGLSLKPAC